MTSWFAFVPSLVAHDILKYPTASPIGREQRFDAVVLFADVSGFTPISEALGKTGRAGTEELTQILNAYFAAMIELVESHGGIVGKFGGDAMTVLFPYTADTRRNVVRSAVQCAIAMQAQMGQFDSISTSAGMFSLAMKAGLALGSVFFTTVGSPTLRLEYVIAGHPLDLCAEAEHEADKGMVVVHNDLLPDLPAETGVVHGDYTEINALHEKAVAIPLPALGDAPPAAISTLSRYVHPTIAHRLSYSQTSFLNEHRKVTVLFISFAGFDYDGDAAVGTKLQAYFEQVVNIIHRYDGYLNKIDMGDKGSKFIVLFGAPVAHENDEERAIRCALDLLALPESSIRVGVNTGFVFAGQVGSAVRQEYTVMGDVVNLSARLMQAATAGSILVSNDTRQMVREKFVWKSLRPIQVKGKSSPIAVFMAQGVAEVPHLHLQELHYALPMVGRNAELTRIEQRMMAALAGKGQVIGITAEAGMGKSRLNAEVITRATRRGFVGYGGECQSYGTTTAYLVWHSLWRSFFSLDPATPNEAQIEHLRRQLEQISPRLAERLPLLDMALNIPIPDNAVTAALEPQLRHDFLRELLMACLRHRAATVPVMLVLEDCQWMDALSQELLAYIVRNCIDVPLLVVMLYRPLERDQLLAPSLRRMRHFSEIELKEFSPDEAAQLIALKLQHLFSADIQIAPAVIERIVTRSAGNPFYIDELINLIHDQGIDPHDTAALEALNLPDSLYNLILSRIDQLKESEKIVIKVASVIGRLFRASWMWGFYPQLGDPGLVKEALGVLSIADLTPLDKPEPELEYLFKHVMTQEVAYSSLAFGVRATLHEELAAYIERTYATNLTPYIDLLAYHYGLSQNRDKQALYFRQAGDSAKSNFAHDAAILYYQRLLPLLPEAEQILTMRQVGDVWHLVGKWDDAMTILTQALTLAETHANRAEQAYCLDSIGYLYAIQFNYAEALPRLRQAIDILLPLDDKTGLLQVYAHLAYTLWQSGSYDEAIDVSNRQLALARAVPDRRAEADALRNMAGVYLNRGMSAEAIQFYSDSLKAAEASAYRLGEIYACINLGVTYFNAGNFAPAMRYYDRALQLANEIGYLQMIALVTGNIGEVYRLMGNEGLAMACNEHSLAVALDLGDWRIISVVCGNSASLFATQQRYQEAEQLFQRSIAIGRARDLAYHNCEYLNAYAQMLTSLHRYEEAQKLNDEALTLATQTERPDIIFEAKLLAIRLNIFLAKLDKTAGIAQLNAILEVTEDAAQKAALHYEIWKMDGSQQAAKRSTAELYQAAYQQSAAATYRRRFVELTGADTLPDAPEVPPLPDRVAEQPLNLAMLLQRLDVMMAGENLSQN